MSNLFLALIVVVALTTILAAFRAGKRNRKQEKLDALRRGWGNQKMAEFDFNKIRRYADVCGKTEYHQLTNQTIEDIDFNGVFAKVDRTCSNVGQQFLYKKMSQPTNRTDNPLRELIALFSRDTALREEVQLELLKLSHVYAYHIPYLLRKNLVERPVWFNLLFVDLVIAGALCLISFVYPVCLLFLLVFVAINQFIHYWNKSNAYLFSASLPQLNVLITVSEKIFAKNIHVPDHSAHENILNLKAVQRKTGYLNFESENRMQTDLGQAGAFLSDLIKGILLVEVISFFYVMKELEDKRASVQVLFSYIGNIDVALSIASLRAGELKICEPLFTTTKRELAMRNMYHPLIDKSVTNDLTLNGKSILITGSNMAGKSTFLRTLMINSILAQTLHICFADEFISPIVRQFSSVRIDDNLLEGTSYFFQEVNTIGLLMEEVKKDEQNLFVLDELFKGTNTVERISAAKAILSYLNRKDNFVFVSTHDIELATMLEAEYDLYHFTESIENNQLHFDYKIKAGPVHTRNAIKLLELSGYPADVVAEANNISAVLSSLPE